MQSVTQEISMPALSSPSLRKFAMQICGNPEFNGYMCSGGDPSANFYKKLFPCLWMTGWNRHSERAVSISLWQAWNPCKDFIEMLNQVQGD